MQALDRKSLPYASCYCEENVRQASLDPRLSSRPRAVVLITNERKTAAVFSQRSAEVGQPAVWDYHVILVVADPDLAVIDLDSTLPLPCPLAAYVDEALAPTLHLPSALRPRFRVAAGDVYAERLWTDRSHMRRTDGSWIQPPPEWDAPLPSNGVPLAEWIDLESDAPGEVVQLPELVEAIERSLAARRSTRSESTRSIGARPQTKPA
ncbi:MAG: hypothetical protein HYV07_33990 [Deltaproteobacteria bacterium]|nr:hypothetical protein [Deltaproteobacteria bacterium]